MPSIPINTNDNVNNVVIELPAQRIVEVTPLSGNQNYLPNSIPAAGSGLKIN